MAGKAKSLIKKMKGLRRNDDKQGLLKLVSLNETIDTLRATYIKAVNKAILLVLLFTFNYHYINAQTAKTDTLLKGFISPSNAAKPRVWWHWMNGNVTKEGIRKDLEWMHRSGIGGFQNFDAAMHTPQIVENRLSYMTPAWKDAFRFTTKLADSLHLEMAIAGSPGWSESGGPWVKPEDGMKKIVWSEITVQGGAANIVLAKVSPATGPFQNIPVQPELDAPPETKAPPIFYKPVAVIAYRLPATDIPLSVLKPIVTSSNGTFTLTQLTDGDLATTNLLPSDTTKGFAWIQFAFAQPQTIKAITIVGGGNKGPFELFGTLQDTRSLEVSDDGVNFKWVCYIPAGNVLQQTISIPVSTAKYFRVTVKNPPPAFSFAALMGLGAPAKPPAGTDIAELVLHTASRINWFEEKAAFAPAKNLSQKITPASTDIIETSDVVNLTNKVNANGTLDWIVPQGRWNIVQFGYSLTGILNHPASPEATGLEVDKLDAGAIRRYFTNYLDQYKIATGGLMGSKGGLQFMVTDSWEAGAQNWTANMMQEFEKRRGYSMVTWLPVLTGHIIKSVEASELFLFDFRKTLAELVAEYHYDGLTKILAERGMKRYSESHENGRTFIADGMDVKRTAAVPMSAMWTPGEIGGGETVHIADIRESASVAHIYGQNLVAAESFTAMGMGGSAWSFDPAKLKPTADLELANGLNRFVVHTSVHQPMDTKIPGLGLGPFGQWFNRHETWAEQAKAWTDYLSRSSYMLQQGKFVADVVYYYGEDNNITSLFSNKLPDLPEGYHYDFVNTDALLRLLKVKDGKIVTPSGMSYRLLVLDSNAIRMTLPVLRKIRELVKAGATISGVRPESSPSLSDDKLEFTSLINEVWLQGNKNVFTGKTITEALRAINVQPDFGYKVSSNITSSEILNPKSEILYVHRRLSNGDVYWVNNRNDRAEDIEATFRVVGIAVEIWHPETGNTEPASYSFANGVTTVSLHLAPHDAVFVVFKNNTNKSSVALPPTKETTLSTVDANWTISFQKDRGAPPEIAIDKLTSWTENMNAGVKYFSGTGTYNKTISADKSWFTKDAQLSIDLGDVKNLAEVFVNGKSLGTVWKKPFVVDVTNTLKPGANKLEIKVTNLWLNRLIGDQQPGVEKKITYTTMPFYRAASPLLPSGLLGPVRILSRSIK